MAIIIYSCHELKCVRIISAHIYILVGGDVTLPACTCCALQLSHWADFCLDLLVLHFHLWTSWSETMNTRSSTVKLPSSLRYQTWQLLVHAQPVNSMSTDQGCGQVCMSGGWDVSMRWEEKKSCNSAFTIKYYINSFNEIEYVYTCKDRVANQYNILQQQPYEHILIFGYICTAILLEGWISKYQINYRSITIVMYTCILFATRNKWTSCWV